MSKQNGKPAKRRPRRLAKVFVLLAGLGLMGAVAGAAGVIAAYFYVAPGLPPAETIRDIPLQIPLRIYSRDGRLIEEVGERRRILVSYDQLPPFLVDAFVAAEDRRFFEHPGVDYQGILRAGFAFIRTGSLSQGGSTITQQLARDYFLTRERLFTRKLREAFLAYKIEQEFSKEEIMALFVNKMFFGQRAYGVAAAAQVYFGKTLDQINVAEAATLAGVLPAPSQYNPVRSPSNAAMRRSYVLTRMRALDFLEASGYQEAMGWPMVSQLHGTANELSAPYVAEMVRREMLSRYGQDTYSAGYKVTTTLDSRLQQAANYSLRNGLLEFTRRRGYRGPLSNIPLDEEVASASYSVWPEELRLALRDYGNPGGLIVAIVTRINPDNSADVVLQNGRRTILPWHGISWAKPFIDRETSGPAPESVRDVLALGDVIYVMPVTTGGYALAQAPNAQSAVVSVDPDDGAITGLAGGFDFSISKYNRVTQAARQPGSSFKPFIYAAALSRGNTLATIINDSPVVIVSSELEDVWRPINYSGRFYGPIRVREALYRSMNLASVRLLLYNTGVGNAVRYLEPFGFSPAALPHNGSLALGGGNAPPLDMAQGYATFSNGGYAVKPYVIDAIYGPDDEVIYRAEPFVVCRECEPGEEEEETEEPEETEDLEAPPIVADDADDTSVLLPDELANALLDDESTMTLDQMALVAESYRPDAIVAPELFESVNLAPRIITPQIAFLIQDAMRSVITRGTGRRARVLGRSDLSGKTGTSNDRRDAWFAGYNSEVVTVVWVGYDDDLPLGPGEEGSRTALPIWIEFMRVALAGTPESQMPLPDGITSVRIDKTTGCRASASDYLEDVTFEYFVVGQLPDCESVDELPDIFNETGEEAEEDESLF